VTRKNKKLMINKKIVLPIVLEREEVVRQYDGKTVVWEKRLMPELVENYKRVKRKEYCDPYFWVITEVEGNKNV
tara:strand:- start:7 stop:228 length:222 start_codon:yes stop_codon:yes gene_type:complete